MSERTAMPAELGSELIETLRAVRADRPAAVLMRHSARDEFTDIRSALVTPLSEEGRTAAAAFGRRLPAGRRLHIRYSYVDRCRETAELIASAYREAGGEALAIEPESSLAGPYVRDVEAMTALANRLGESFPREWFDGRVPPEVIASRNDATAVHLRLVLDVLRGSEPAAIHLLVSHDWNIMAVRETLLGLRHEEVGWLAYLDGLVFAMDGEKVEVTYRGSRAILDPARAPLLP